MTLDQVRESAPSLPDATEEPHFANSFLRVRGKTFTSISRTASIYTSSSPTMSTGPFSPRNLTSSQNWGGAPRGGLARASASAKLKVINALIDAGVVAQGSRASACLAEWHGLNSNLRFINPEETTRQHQGNTVPIYCHVTMSSEPLRIPLPFLPNIPSGPIEAAAMPKGGASTTTVPTGMF